MPKAILKALWLSLSIMMTACLLSLGCATTAFRDYRTMSRPPKWNPTLEITKGTAQAYILEIKPLAGGGRNYDILLRGLLKDRPMDWAFLFAVQEKSGTAAEIALAEASLVTVGDRRGRPLDIWYQGEHPANLTHHDGAPDQVLVAPPTWKGTCITFPLTWRTPEGDLHHGNLTLHLRSEHHQMLLRLRHDFVTITGSMGLAVVDITLYVAVIIPAAIVLTPTVAIEKFFRHP